MTDDETVARLLDAIATAVDAFRNHYFGPVENLPPRPEVSAKRAEAGRKGGLSSQAKKRANGEANFEAKQAFASPHPTPSLDGGGDGGGGKQANALKQSNQASNLLEPTDLLPSVRERERLVSALPAQYAHVDNPERFYQLAEQAFRGDGERYERAVIEFHRLREDQEAASLPSPRAQPTSRRLNSDYPRGGEDE